MAVTEDEITARIVSIVEQVEKYEASRRTFSIVERIAIALVPDRADWLKELDWTILWAIDGLGGQWFRAAQRAWPIHSERE
jgi:hypothetical protein